MWPFNSKFYFMCLDYSFLCFVHFVSLLLRQRSGGDGNGSRRYRLMFQFLEFIIFLKTDTWKKSSRLKKIPPDFQYLTTANQYFALPLLNTQMIYSLSLNSCNISPVN